MAERWIVRPDCRIYVVDEGEGPAVVVLHGGLADHHAVLPMASALRDRYRVIAPDLRGSGRSHFAAEISFEQMTADLGAIADALGIDEWFVVAVSSGTGPAVHHALADPDRVGGLVLVHPIYAGESRGYTDAQSTTLAGMDALASRAASEGPAALEPLYAQLPSPMRERALAIALRFDGPSVAATSRFLVRGVQPFESAETDLARLAAPTLLVRGVDDLHPPEISNLYADNLPSRMISDAPYDRVPNEIAAFLDGVRSAAD